MRCLVLINSKAISSLARALGQSTFKIILEIISSSSPFSQGGLPVSHLFSFIAALSSAHELTTPLLLKCSTYGRKHGPLNVSHGAKWFGHKMGVAFHEFNGFYKVLTRIL